MDYWEIAWVTLRWNCFLWINCKIPYFSSKNHSDYSNSGGYTSLSTLSVPKTIWKEKWHSDAGEILVEFFFHDTRNVSSYHYSRSYYMRERLSESFPSCNMYFWYIENIVSRRGNMCACANTHNKDITIKYLKSLQKENIEKNRRKKLYGRCSLDGFSRKV